MSGLPRRRQKTAPDVLVQFRVSAAEHAALVGRAAAEGLTLAAQAKRDVMAANRSPTSATVNERFDQVWQAIGDLRRELVHLCATGRRQFK